MFFPASLEGPDVFLQKKLDLNSKFKFFHNSPHCKTLIYTYIPLYKFAVSGGKLKSWLAKKLLCFLAWIKVASLQDIAVNDEGGKFLQKCDLQY